MSARLPRPRRREAHVSVPSGLVSPAFMVLLSGAAIRRWGGRLCLRCYQGGALAAPRRYVMPLLQLYQVLVESISFGKLLD
jgi:hypothetical protein